MQWMVISIFFFATCEFPVLHAKKVVVMMSRQVRRGHPFPWRNASMMVKTKKNGFLAHGSFIKKNSHPLRPEYYSPKNLQFTKNQLPQGGDDFDQGHEEVNNVIVPHGKGITHAVFFGNGYIPYGSYKNNPASHSHHHDYQFEDQTAQKFHYDSAVNYPDGLSQTEPYLSQQAGIYLTNENCSGDELEDRIQGHGTEKFVTGNPPRDFPNNENGEPRYGTAQRVQEINNKVGGYLLPANPQPTSDGNKQGIVLRDSIVLDDYHRKIAEMTKGWPSSFSGNFAHGAISPSAVHQGTGQQNRMSRQFDDSNTLAGLSHTTIFPFIFREHQNDQGYAVKEDIVDTPHDFRTMPINTAPAQTLQKHVHQILQHQPPHQIIHEQPVAETMQHIFPQTQLPVNHALPNYQAYIYG